MNKDDAYMSKIPNILTSRTVDNFWFANSPLFRIHTCSLEKNHYGTRISIAREIRHIMPLVKNCFFFQWCNYTWSLRSIVNDLADTDNLFYIEKTCACALFQLRSSARYFAFSYDPYKNEAQNLPSVAQSVSQEERKIERKKKRKEGRKAGRKEGRF